MCFITTVHKTPIKETGIGWKIVRRTSKPDVFTPEWPFMLLNGKGGVPADYVTRSLPGELRKNLLF